MLCHGFQDVPGIWRVTFHITNSFWPTGSGEFWDVGWFSSTLSAGTLGSAGGSVVSVGVGGRELIIISYNDMISWSCLYPIEKGDNRGWFSPPQPDPHLHGRRRRCSKNLRKGIHVGRIWFSLPLTRVVFLGYRSCSIYSALGEVQGIRPTLHYGQRWAGHLAPHKISTLVPGGTRGVQLKPKAPFRKASDYR